MSNMSKFLDNKSYPESNNDYIEDSKHSYKLPEIQQYKPWRNQEKSYNNDKENMHLPVTGVKDLRHNIMFTSIIY